ncbi:MAG: Molybdenum cofactor biosynthesis protein [Pseudomonadota bacterium]
MPKRKLDHSLAKIPRKKQPARVRVAQLTHLDTKGHARMVDVAAKPITARSAVAKAAVKMLPATLRVLRSGKASKGDVLAAARIAGIQASKRTHELIPLCHALALTSSEVDFAFVGRDTLSIEARVYALDRTGVEMEALTAASVAALTVYDMLKAIDRGMTIERIALHEKVGGKSGRWTRR